MIEELIYTSAVQGLKSGSKGFCTVASTAGMPANLVSLLESLSGYRHLADPGSPSAAQNPVVHNHLKIRLGGRSLQVLSRVADAGLDYSGRSNKIAHHVVLSAVKLPICGPASVQVQAGFHEDGWTDEPHLIDHPRALPSRKTSPVVCRYWQEVTEDAGWGGVLAERLLRSRDNEQWIIYPLGVDPLRLLEETLALLPPDLRWQITYTTFYTKLPPGIDCRVRWVVDGTPEAQQLRKRYQLQALDLCDRIPAPPEGALTTAARTGSLAEVRQTATRKKSVPLESSVVLADEDSYEVDLADVVSAAPPPLPGGPTPAPSSESQLVGNSTEHKNAWVLAGALAALLFLVAGFLTYFGYRQMWFGDVVASKNEQQSETPSQEPQEKDGANKTENKQTESGDPIENQPSPNSKVGDTQNLTKDASTSAVSPQGSPTDPPQRKNSEDGQQNIISKNASSGMSVNQEATGSVESSKEKGRAKPKSPFPGDIIILDKVIKGEKSSIQVSQDDDKRLAVHFFYPKSNDEGDLPYHLTGKQGDWTLLPSNKNKPTPFKGLDLLAITRSGDQLVFKADKRTLNSKKYKLLVGHSIVNLLVTSEEVTEPFSCDVRFLETQKKGVLRIADPPEDSTKFLRKLHHWEEDWVLKDLSVSWEYFLKLNNEDNVQIHFSHQQDGTKGFEKPFRVDASNYFDVDLLAKVTLRQLESGSLIRVKLTWVPNPKRALSINAREPKFILEKVEGLFETTLKWKKFKKKYATTSELSNLTWQEWKEELDKEELDKPDGKDQPFGIKKEKIAGIRESFGKIGDMTEIPDTFDPDTELQFLKNLHADLELGIKLESYPSTTEKQLILITTTKKNDSSSEGQK